MCPCTTRMVLLPRLFTTSWSEYSIVQCLAPTSINQTENLKLYVCWKKFLHFLKPEGTRWPKMDVICDLFAKKRLSNFLKIIVFNFRTISSPENSYLYQDDKYLMVCALNAAKSFTIIAIISGHYGCLQVWRERRVLWVLQKTMQKGQDLWLIHGIKKILQQHFYKQFSYNPKGISTNPNL